MQRTGGMRYKTRHKLQKRARDKGKLPITKLMTKFEIGDRVRILPDSGQHSGFPHPRFKNAVGLIQKKQGDAYLIEVKDINKTKQVLSKPVHLRKL